MLHQQPPSCAPRSSTSPLPESERLAGERLDQIYAIVRSKTGGSQQLDIDDLAQSGWIRQHLASAQYANRNNALESSYVHRVVCNSVTDDYRRESKHESKVRCDLDFDGPDSDLAMHSGANRFYTPDQFAEYQDTLDALSAVFPGLPPRQQMLLERHCLGAGDSIKVLAEEFQCSVQSLYQARDALFQKLDCAGVSPPQ